MAKAITFNVSGYDPSDTCPKATDSRHLIDWGHVFAERGDQGGTVYLHVFCALCARTGCIGSKEQLVDMTNWSNE